MSDDYINPQIVYPQPKFTPEDEAEIEKYVDKIHEKTKEEELTPRERFSLAARGIEPDRVPFMIGVAVISGPQPPPPYDKYGIKDYLENPTLYFRATMALNAEFDMDVPGRIWFTNGQEEWAGKENVHYPKMGIPVWKNPVVKNLEDVDRLRMVEPRTDGKYPWNLWMYKMQSRYIGDICVTWGKACSGPLSAAWPLLGNTGLPLLWKKNREVVHKFLDKYIKFDVDLVRACYESGSDLVWLCEAVSRNSPPMMEDLVRYSAQLNPASQYAPFGLVPTTGTASMFHLNLMAQKAKPFGMVMSTPTEYYEHSKRAPTLEEQRKYMLENEIMGFHGIAHTIIREDPSVIDSEVKRTIKMAAPGGRCTIIAGGQDWHMKYEKIRAMIKSAKKYGKYPIKI